MTDKLLTRQEVAKLLNVKSQTIYRWTKAGKLPSYRMSYKVIRYKQEDVDKLIDSFDIKHAEKVLKDIDEGKTELVDGDDVLKNIG